MVRLREHRRPSPLEALVLLAMLKTRTYGAIATSRGLLFRIIAKWRVRQRPILVAVDYRATLVAVGTGGAT